MNTVRSPATISIIRPKPFCASVEVMYTSEPGGGELRALVSGRILRGLRARFMRALEADGRCEQDAKSGGWSERSYDREGSPTRCDRHGMCTRSVVACIVE